METDRGLVQAVHRAAEVVANGMTPARREAFMQGAAWIGTVLAEAGFREAVGDNVHLLVDRLNRAKGQAEETLRRMQQVTFDAGDMDEKGRATLALTGALLRAFNDTLQPRDFHGSRVVDDKTGQQIARAVSYIVWAYLRGASWPEGEPVEDDSDA